MPQSMYYALLDSPLGQLVITSNGQDVTGVYLPEHEAWQQMQQGVCQPALFVEVARQFEAYFSGKLSHFNLPLAPSGTEFQRRVWQTLCRIPYGKTLTYKELAHQIGHPSASRAVGAANSKNPISIIIPCHRVIGADGTLTGYASGVAAKEWLLAHEGALAKAFSI